MPAPDPAPAPTPAPPPLPGPIFDEPVFQDGHFLPDPFGFHVPHPSDNALYAQLGKLLSTQTTPVPLARGKETDLYTLSQAFGAAGPDIVGQIQQAGQIVFHAVGDTGCSNAARYTDEITVADRMVGDFNEPVAALRPSFLFHLGDVVYNFGESKYYYDEFYEPFRNYPRPIFAIAGNHDSFVVPHTPVHQRPLEVFKRNFCATHPVVTPEANSLHRTAATQPGIYFALDAPYVRIIGLFSNALEDPGVISSQAGKWPGVADVQLHFLRQQLQKVVDDKYSGALLVAVHHPPFVYSAPDVPGRSAHHGGSPDMLRDIDTVCTAAGVYPHAIISGHAHNYQRFTRKLNFAGRAIEVPFVVAGSGGHNVTSLVRDGSPRPMFGLDVSYLERHAAVTTSGLVLEKYDDQNYGYLTIGADPNHLRIGFYNTANPSPQQARFDLVTIDLATRQRVAN